MKEIIGMVILYYLGKFLLKKIRKIDLLPKKEIEKHLTSSSYPRYIDKDKERELNLEKWGHPIPKDKDVVVKWAREVLREKERYVILDTETTGLGENDVVIQIAIADMEGNILLNTPIKPTQRKRMSAEATAIHGFTIKDLQNAPTFVEILDMLLDIVKRKKVLIYNAEFDERLIDQTCEQDGIRYPVTSAISELCVMEKYAQFVGKYSKYHDDYTWQKLPNSKHDAASDCLAVLQVIKKMAETDLIFQENHISIVESFNESDFVPSVLNGKQERKWWELEK